MGRGGTKKERERKNRSGAEKQAQMLEEKSRPRIRNRKNLTPSRKRSWKLKKKLRKRKR